MKGFVDERNRALIDISIRTELEGESSRITVWIDTAFDGHLVFSASLIEELGLLGFAGRSPSRR